ncbi:glycerol kinase GlpK [Kinneretia aquatilis]|uniref:glycerol kinase GlpK n=1 Tax=Kinneretia aquatilis TaxID=2070761 RepID=UPI001495283E|nr:glycerol kinase GlpK [Paucibacter aquatile]WIV98391.1 glycerol kinase GlpK [Paucibacter aquatile]
MSYLLALDQGTSSSRAIVFERSGRIVAMAQQEFAQHFPQPGWVEHDALEIWQSQRATAQAALRQADLRAADIAAVGITNQRETTVLWDRQTGHPLHRAIVWQDRRTEPFCAQLRARDLTPMVRAKTGLLIDPYFSGTKLKWLLDHIPGARARAERGELAFGTIDSWLIWNLTGGAVHATDVSNASRTLLFNVQRNRWDEELLALMDIPPALLPEVRPSSGDFGRVTAAHLGGEIAIGGVAGDQQAALFGQACFQPGMAKNTYGTGCFMLMHTGRQFQTSANGLINTSAAQTTASPEFALEGSVFVGGAVVQWLRDGLQIIPNSGAVQSLAESVPDAGGVMFVPAFTGLGAPYWRAEARGAILGLSRGSTQAHIARAAIESIAFQSAALLQAMSRDAHAAGSAPLQELRVDGGACVNDLLMQFQADLLGIAVVRPRVIETTALGAAYLAGLSCGVYTGLDELSAQWQAERRFEPSGNRAQAAERMAAWEHAVRQVTAG